MEAEYFSQKDWTLICPTGATLSRRHFRATRSVNPDIQPASSTMPKWTRHPAKTRMDGA